MEETETPVKKKRRKRRQSQPVEIKFDRLVRACAILGELKELPWTPKGRKALAVLTNAVESQILATPALLFARLAAAQNGHAAPGGPSPVPAPVTATVQPVPQPDNRQRTVGAEAPVISLSDIDLFIAEETPGRWTQFQLGARLVPVIFLSREEYGALRRDLAAEAGDLEGFKADIAKIVPDDLVVQFFQNVVAVYKGCAIRV